VLIHVAFELRVLTRPQSMTSTTYVAATPMYLSNSKPFRKVIKAEKWPELLRSRHAAHQELDATQVQSYLRIPRLTEHPLLDRIVKRHVREPPINYIR
jgi:hypothetical protein